MSKNLSFGNATRLAAVAVCVLAIAACSTESPSSPKPQPTPTANSLSLTLTPSTAYEGDVVQVTARATIGSSPVADGTSILFRLDGCNAGTSNFLLFFTPNFASQPEGRCEITKATEGGAATVYLYGTAAGTATVVATMPNKSTTVNVPFLSGSAGGASTIYYLDPPYGSANGGELVTIYGANLGPNPTVMFEGYYQAQVEQVASDNRWVIVRTPRIVNIPADGKADVSVAVSGLTTGSLADAFALVENETPALYSIEPNSGPVEGGTRVTLSGKSFLSPVQVMFNAGGDRQAQVVSVNYNQIIAISPSITPSEPNTPTTAQVRVINTSTGKSSGTVSFRYGEAMFISGITPSSGPAEQQTEVVITGQGFSSPLKVQVEINNLVLDAQPMDVGGTRIVAKLPAVPENARECEDMEATVTVTNLASNLSAEGDFTYRATRPLISSVMQTDSTNVLSGCYAGTYLLTIRGSGFSQAGVGSGMSVTIGSQGTMMAEYIDAQTLRVTLPVGFFTGMLYDTVSCDAGGGIIGRINVQTAIPVTVTNVTTDCSDTLIGALLVNPCSPVCTAVAAPTLLTVTPSVGPVAGGTMLTITGTNFTSGATVTVGGNPAAVSGVTATQITATTPPGAIAGPVAVSVTTTGGTATLPGAFTYQATLATTVSGVTVTSNPAGINCPGTCGPATFSSSPVLLSASAASTWSGGCAGCASGTSCSVIMNVNKTCTVTLIPAPTITDVSPTSGPAAGGTSVTITGTNFTGATAVSFGGTPATFLVDSATQITATTPAHAAGAVAVSVTTPGGTATLPAGFTFI